MITLMGFRSVNLLGRKISPITCFRGFLFVDRLNKKVTASLFLNNFLLLILLLFFFKLPALHRLMNYLLSGNIRLLALILYKRILVNFRLEQYLSIL